MSKYNSPTYIVQLALKHIFLVQFTVNYTNNVTFLGFMALSRPKIYQSMSNLTSFAPKYIIDFEFWVDFSIKTEGAQARVQNGSIKRFLPKHRQLIWGTPCNFYAPLCSGRKTLHIGG